MPSDAGGSGGPRMVSPTLVGRDDELGSLLSALATPPTVAIVQGEAGIGKTRLVTELSQHRRLADRRWAWGGCRGIQEPFPLGPVLEAVGTVNPPQAPLSPVAGALRALLPELAAALPPAPPPLEERAAARHQVFRGLAELLAALGPTVLVLEDLHWADEQTVELLQYLLSAPPEALSLVLTFRDDEAPAPVAALAARLPPEVGRAGVRLAPLDAAGTGELAAAILRTRVSERFASELVRRCSGLPFAVEELLALLRTRGHGDLTPEALADLGVPAGIRAPVLERVATLSPVARAAVETLAVLRGPVPARVLAAVGDPARPGLLDALEEALRGGLLTDHGDTVGFRHPLAAESVYQEITGPRRQDLHDRAAAALAELDPVPLGQVAYHLLGAGRHREWLAAAEQAADRATELGDDAGAAHLLEQVLRHPALDPDGRGRVAMKLAQAAIQTVRVTGAVTDLLEEVLAGDLAPPVRGELAFRVALLHEAAGADAGLVRRRYTDAVHLLQRPDLRAWVMTGLAVPTSPGVRLSEHRQWLRRSADLIPEVEDPQFRVFLRGKAAMVLVVTGDRQWRHVTAGIEADTGGAPRHRREVNAYQSVGMAAAYAGHHRWAARLLDAAAAGAAACGSRELDLRVRSARAVLDYACGRWHGLAETVAVLDDELAGHAVSRIDVAAVAGELALAHGDTGRARERLADVAARAEEVGGCEVFALAADALARLALGQGEPSDAYSVVRRFLDTVAAKDWWSPMAGALPTVTEVLLAAGPDGAAAELVATAKRELSGLDAPAASATLREADGVLAAADGEWARAGRCFGEAAERHRAGDRPYEAARAAERTAGALLATGDRSSAEGMLTAALTGYRGLGAGWDRDRVARTARRHHLPVSSGRRGGGRSYGESLSPREREVADLAAVGKTNRQIAAELFLSPKTVDKHVSAALRKLGVHTRSGLARRLDAAATVGVDAGGREDTGVAGRRQDGVITP